MATSPLPPTPLPGGIEAGGGGEEGGGGGGALIHSPPVESTGKENSGGGSMKLDGKEEGVGERSGLKRGEEEVSNPSGLHKCQYCAKHYSSSHSLRTHEKWHRGDLGHPCSHCDKKFRNPSEVRRHEMTHTGEKPHKCPHCPTKFIQKVHLMGKSSIPSSQTSQRNFLIKCPVDWFIYRTERPKSCLSTLIQFVFLGVGVDRKDFGHSILHMIQSTES